MLIPIGNRLINTDHIVSVTETRGPDDKPRWVVTLVNGETFSTPYRLGDIAGAIVPAPPGLTLIEAFFPSPGVSPQAVTYALTIVVAFRVLDGVAPTPIGLQGPSASDADLCAVIQPDGRCVAMDEAWDSVTAFKAACEVRSAAKAPLAVPQVAAPPAALPASQSGEAETPPTKLQAEILATPIRPVGPSALWRDGIGMGELVAAVRDRHPSLHAGGIGYNPKWGWKWGPDDIAKARAEMTDPGKIEEFTRAFLFLNYAGAQFATNTINTKRWSYSWKHIAERVMGAYVSNGMFLTAAYALGYQVEINPESPNHCINLSEKAVALDPQKGVG